MDELAKNEQLGDLYAYYGSLLTPGQRAYFEDYYYNDLSLGEIAENRQVSRQAVYDNLRRSSISLQNFERKLGLQKQNNLVIAKLRQALQAIDQGQTPNARACLQEILQDLS